VKDMRRNLVIVFALVLLAGLLWFYVSGHRAPAGQPALKVVDDTSVRELKAEFNRAADRTRIILLLSPT
jgi:hypothetical protein